MSPLPLLIVNKNKSSHILRFEAEGRARWQETAPCYLNAFDATSGARKMASFYGKSKRMIYFRDFWKKGTQNSTGFARRNRGFCCRGPSIYESYLMLERMSSRRMKCVPVWEPELGFSLPIPPPLSLTSLHNNEASTSLPSPLLPLQQLVFATFCDDKESLCRSSSDLEVGDTGRDRHQYRLTLTFRGALGNCSHRKVVEATVSAFHKGESHKMTVNLVGLSRKLLFALQEQRKLRQQYTTIVQRLDSANQPSASDFARNSPPSHTHTTKSTGKHSPEDACHFTLSLQ